MTLLPVEDALARVLHNVNALDIETVPLAQAANRVLATSLAACRNQPDFVSSAMDGYAVQGADLNQHLPLLVIGTAVAGRAFAGDLQAGQAVRIFTGAPVPKGADTVVMQEHVERVQDRIRITTAPPLGANIRSQGLDFKTGQTLLQAGTRLGPRDLALAAAMNHAALPVRRRPVVAILSTGDELRMPGEPIGHSESAACNGLALGGLARVEGAEVIDLGIAKDDPQILTSRIEKAITQKVDLLVTIGGASVGERDFVQAALKMAGVEIGFWRIAMRPGKPMMHGRKGAMHVLGLPGNPAAAFVCGVVFVVPLIRALMGKAPLNVPLRPAQWAVDWKANDSRQDYLRATLDYSNPARLPQAAPLTVQDSSLSGVLQQADCLIVRPPFAPAAKRGEACRMIDLRAAGY